MRRLLLATLSLAVLCSCGAYEKVYVWERQGPAIGRKGPTTFEVRLNVDVQAKKVSWLEHVYDHDGDIGSNIYSYEGCAIFDSENWNCSILPGRNDISFKDGTLSRLYWGEDQHFTSKSVLKKKYLP